MSEFYVMQRPLYGEFYCDILQKRCKLAAVIRTQLHLQQSPDWFLPSISYNT